MSASLGWQMTNATPRASDFRENGKLLIELADPLGDVRLGDAIRQLRVDRAGRHDRHAIHALTSCRRRPPCRQYLPVI
jgi:hypothetical protein